MEVDGIVDLDVYVDVGRDVGVDAAGAGSGPAVSIRSLHIASIPLVPMDEFPERFNRSMPPCSVRLWHI